MLFSSTTLMVFALALALRVAGASLGVGERARAPRMLGWLFGALAAWVFALAWGIWAPLWVALGVTIVMLATERERPRYALRPAFDLIVVTLTGLTALPLALANLLAAAVAFMAVGILIDLAIWRLPRQPRRLVTPLMAVALVGAAVVAPGAGDAIARFFSYRSATAFAPPWQALAEQPQPTVMHMPLVASTAAGGSLDRSGAQWELLEWRIANPSVQGNPFDLAARVTFTHSESGEQRATEMFYVGNDEWRFRFTGTRPGTWTFTTASSDPELGGKYGTITLQPAHADGFLVGRGAQWVWSGSGRAVTPQLVMIADPDRYAADPGRLARDLDTFLGDHGFNGVHIQVFCRWFELARPDCNAVNRADPNPDLGTFAVLDQVILQTYARGGSTHIWAWGDDMRGQNPKRWGLNGAADQRLQRYIAARLGPLPGWSMGYGFDLFEWVDGAQIDTWHDYMQARLGWPHLLGARAATNQLGQLTERLDYAAYEQHRPDYATYVATIGARPQKPSFSEDRFRIRDEGRSKDYTAADIRRGLWRSTMAGGVANIWGNLSDGRSHEEGSAAYPNAAELKTYGQFWSQRFATGLERCPELSAGHCLRWGHARYVIYQEDAASVTIDLSAMERAQPVVALDTRRPYAEIVVGQWGAGRQTWQAPYQSDWALAIGGF